MTPHKHAALIKQWADGAEIEYWNPNYRRWVHGRNPEWDSGTDYRIKPHARIVSILGGVATTENGVNFDLRWIQGLLNEAYTAHGHMDFAKGANLLAGLTGMAQGPQDQWYTGELK